MRPISLTLTGFIGIRDGMNIETLTLDFERMTAGAQLVPIVGPNGRGKTTVLDNMTPYATMPSKAGADGLGGFSYYDEVYLPVNRKELVWEMGKQRCRTQIIIRLNGKRRSEAYRHEDDLLQLNYGSKAAGCRVMMLVDQAQRVVGSISTGARCAELSGRQTIP